MSINIRHSVTLFPQPTNMTCWSAAATMLFGNMSVGSGGATTSAGGGLNSSSGNVRTFADSFGLAFHYPQSWTVDGLAGLMGRGPLWVGGMLPSMHAIVIGAMKGNGTPNGTILTIYDPWPPNVGRVYNISYGRLMNNFPMATMYILHR